MERDQKTTVAAHRNSNRFGVTCLAFVFCLVKSQAKLWMKVDLVPELGAETYKEAPARQSVEQQGCGQKKVYVTRVEAAIRLEAIASRSTLLGWRPSLLRAQQSKSNSAMTLCISQPSCQVVKLSSTTEVPKKKGPWQDHLLNCTK